MIAQRWTEHSKSRIYSNRLSTNQALVEYMKAQDKPPELFISVSAVGYYGTHNLKTFTETDVPESYNGSFSTALCDAWEKEAFHGKAQGIRTVLLRIGPVLEQEGGMLAKLFPSFCLGLGSQIGDGQQWLSWIDKDNLIELILLIIRQESLKRPVNATSPNPMTNKEFSLALAGVLSHSCFLKTPEFVFKIIFVQMAEEIMLNEEKVLPKKAVNYGFQFFLSNNSRITFKNISTIKCQE
ncbi:MAG: TIGR01777 family oxidoreductase [Proteobacteria bacterium]|nr:TIGR01777 family oxidoreductase [Pseudomonadota bacterium]